MSGAVDQWLDLDSMADVQRADSLGRIELVTGHGEQIDAELIDAVSAPFRRSATHRYAAARPRRGRLLAISAIGCSVPVSLLACMIETTTVSGRSGFFTSSGSTWPWRSTGT